MAKYKTELKCVLNFIYHIPVERNFNKNEKQVSSSNEIIDDKIYKN